MGKIQKTLKDKEAGYSLLEILIVLAIMAVLATAVAPRLFTQLDKSRITAAKAQAKSIRLALDSFKLDTGRYPTEQEGLKVLMTAPQNDNGSWFGPYMDGDLPKDPWQNDFIYEAPKLDSNGRELSPHVISLGSDNAPGGTGDAADISS
ncbi:MAG TPA: type II secretion system protein GspG [Hellea balneolensis]|uniref:Type II secretion system core protein G n=1 Tax=Hellea balneolensis TaxID=287478 RepID=A0A7C3C4E8_9PROT|nr:type II secretion system protein GspG [Hellea balneolensis]